MSSETKELQSYSPQGLISQALAQNVPIETLERLMDLSERWDAKQAKKRFFESLCLFQSNVPELTKSKKVNYKFKDGSGEVNYSFMPLPKMIKVIQPFLLEAGLSYRFEYSDFEADKMKCTCILTHIDGHYETNSMVVKEDRSGKKNDIQSIGSARSYAERYTLKGVLGLSTADEDNDGKTSGKPKETIPEPQEKVNWGKLIKGCETLEELTGVWERMSEQEKEAYKNNFSKLKANIQSAKKNEGR